MTKLRRIKEIQGWELGAQDGAIGRCADFLFDEENWAIRYTVADTRKWLPGRKVLISPIAIGTLEGMSNTLNVALTKEQIKNAPPLESDAPVSRRYEIAFNNYYDWTHYWGDSSVWGPHLYPRLLHRPDNGQLKNEGLEQAPEVFPEEKTNLRSAGELFGYTIHAADSDIGHVEDFLIDEETWIIRYLVIDTRNWLPGGTWVLISPEWVSQVEWADQSVTVDLTAEQIEGSPAFDPSVSIDREYEKVLFNYYGKPYYF